MRTRHAIWAACAALAFSCAASAQEKVKLEYKLTPGTELLYKTSGNLSFTSISHGSMEASLSGSLRFFVADVDSSGAMLVGCQPDTKAVGKVGGEDRVQNNAGLSLCRMDRAGNPAPLKPKDGKLPAGMAEMLFQLYHREADPITLPVGEVAAGATWNSETDAAILMGLPAEPMPAKIASTLAEIKIVDGRKCAVIESRFAPSDRKLTPGQPQFAVSGEVTTLFDIDGGFSRNIVAKLDLKVALNDENKKEEVSNASEITLTLDSMKTLPDNQAMALSQALKAFEEAVAGVSAGNTAKAAGAIGRMNPEGLPQAWLAGFSGAADSLKDLASQAGAKP